MSTKGKQKKKEKKNIFFFKNTLLFRRVVNVSKEYLLVQNSVIVSFAYGICLIRLMISPPMLSKRNIGRITITDLLTVIQ